MLHHSEDFVAKDCTVLFKQPNIKSKIQTKSMNTFFPLNRRVYEQDDNIWCTKTSYSYTVKMSVTVNQ